jgi:hypothetical protein
MAAFIASTDNVIVTYCTKKCLLLWPRFNYVITELLQDNDGIIWHTCSYPLVAVVTK